MIRTKDGELIWINPRYIVYIWMKDEDSYKILIDKSSMEKHHTIMIGAEMLKRLSGALEENF